MIDTNNFVAMAIKSHFVFTERIVFVTWSLLEVY